MKKIIYIAGILTILILGLFIYNKISDLQDSKLFQKKDPKIDNTSTTIIQKLLIGELTTAVFYSEDFIKDEKITKNFGIFNKKHKLTLVMKTKVRAGINIETLNKKDINILGDTLNITLPKIEILNVENSFTNYDVISEKGKWSDEETNKLMDNLKDKITEQAITDGILKVAEENCTTKIRSLLLILGFKEIIINYKK